MSFASRVTLLAAAIREKFNMITPRLLPAGGAVGQVLKRTGAGDYVVGWGDEAAGGGVGATLTIPTDIAEPAAPAENNLTAFGKKIGGRAALAIKGPFGKVDSLQPFLGRQYGLCVAQPIGGGSTTMNVLGAAVTASGTATAAAMAVTNIHTFLQRLEYAVTTAAATAVAGWRGGNTCFIIGAPGARFGGFQMVHRFGRSRGVAANATLRGFVGMCEATSAASVADQDPSAASNMQRFVGVGCDAADTNWQIMHRVGSGTPTKVNTGFPKAVADNTEMYELVLSAPQGRGGQVDIEFTHLSDGATFTHSITTDLPANDALLLPRGHLSVGGTSAVIGYAHAGCWIAPE